LDGHDASKGWKSLAESVPNGANWHAYIIVHPRHEFRRIDQGLSHADLIEHAERLDLGHKNPHVAPAPTPDVLEAIRRELQSDPKIEVPIGDGVVKYPVPVILFEDESGMGATRSLIKRWLGGQQNRKVFTVTTGRTRDGELMGEPVRDDIWRFLDGLSHHGLKEIHLMGRDLINLGGQGGEPRYGGCVGHVYHRIKGECPNIRPVLRNELVGPHSPARTNHTRPKY